MTSSVLVAAESDETIHSLSVVRVCGAGEWQAVCGRSHAAGRGPRRVFPVSSQWPVTRPRESAGCYRSRRCAATEHATRERPRRDCNIAAFQVHSNPHSVDSLDPTRATRETAAPRTRIKGEALRDRSLRRKRCACAPSRCQPRGCASPCDPATRCFVGCPRRAGAAASGTPGTAHRAPPGCRRARPRRSRS